MRTISPARYRWITFLALALLVAIIISGALVRLTASGLGCSDWPRCSESKFIDVSSTHSAIEQINRLFTGAVSLAVIVAVLGALVRAPRRRDLTWLSISLVAGVLGQAVLGGIVVKTDLNPVAVQGHFVLSIVLITAAMVLHRRAAEPDGGIVEPAVTATSRRLVRVLGVAMAAVVVLGTVVTGAGPHSGSVDDRPVPRFDVAITTIARFHSIAVWVTLAIALGLAWRVSRNPGDRAALERPLTVFLCLGIAQGAVGYIQYFSDVPAALVAVHIALATALWLALTWTWLSTRNVVTPAHLRPTPARSV